MLCRDLSEDEFDLIVAELSDSKHQSGGIEMVTGQHAELGNIILFRDETRCMALVQEPSFIDLLQATGGTSAEAAVLSMVMRAARH